MSYDFDQDLKNAQISKEAQKVDLATLSTTSAKIRALSNSGKTRSEIAKLLKIRYQHVRNVLITPISKEKA